MTGPLSERDADLTTEAEHIQATIPPETQARILAEVAQWVGIDVTCDPRYFTTQIPLRVQAAVKSAALWDVECEQTRIKIYGRP